MKKIATNKLFLKNIFLHILSDFDKYGMVFIDWDFVKHLKTKKQLGFIFGGLVSAIQQYKFENDGYKPEKRHVIEDLYEIASPIKERQTLLGEIKKCYLTLSEMTKEEASLFIEGVIDYIDNHTNIILTPDLRYTWVNNIEDNQNLCLSIDNFLKTWKREYPEYLSYIRKQACISCGVFGCEAHHLRMGNQSGISLKNPDYMTIPLCKNCHNILHQKGELSFYDDLKGIYQHLGIEKFSILCFARWIYKKQILTRGIEVLKQ